MEKKMNGVGLAFAEYTYVHPSGRGESNQLAADDDGKIFGLSRLASTMKSKGALAGLQLVHNGGKSHSSLTQGPLLGPSAIAVPTISGNLETPMSLDKKSIHEMRSWYIETCPRELMDGGARKTDADQVT